MARSLRLAAVITATLTAVCAQSSTSTLPKIEFEKYTLPNGLQVILHVDRKLPVVHVNQWFHVGSANERPGRSGFAHLFEHMMFQGSKNVGKYISEVEVLGASVFQGAVNGTTSWERTNYFATVPSGSLETLLWVEADRLMTLPDAITKEKLDNQRDVVKNERRQGLENQPYGRGDSIIMENVFPLRHPYANDIIGSHEDLTAATLDDVREFFRRYYTPNNLSLVIAGDFDPAHAKKLIEKYFGQIAPGPALDRPVKWVPMLTRPKIIEVSDRVPQERVYMAWPTPGFFEKGDGELDLLSSILTNGLSSRLRRRLIYDEQLCSEVAAYQQTIELASVFNIVATARPGVPLAKIEAAIGGELRNIADSGPTEAELSRAKTQWEYQFVSGLERIGGFGGKADALNRYNTMLGEPGKFEADMARYRNATAADVKATAAEWLANAHHVTVRFHPEKSSRPQTPPTDMSKRPSPEPDRKFMVPTVQSKRLENGMDLFVVTRPELPKVSVRFTTLAGSARDAAEKNGLADLTASVVRRGTRTRKALEIDEELNSLGAQLGSSAALETAGVTVEVLRRTLDPALAVFADVIRNPSFPEAEVTRERALRLDQLARQSKEPNALAGRIGNMIAFGPGHPFGRPRQGLPGTVSKLTPEDMRLFHATYWKPGSSALIFAGDITLADAEAAARKHFGSWTGGAAPALQIPPPQPLGPGKTYVVDREGAAQTVVSQVMFGAPRTAPDYFTYALADTIFGGGFNTRLNLNLREEKGYSYGVFTITDQLNDISLWRSVGGVQTDKTKESIAEFRKELTGLAGEKPITESELTDARGAKIRAFAGEFETLANLTGKIAFLWKQKLPLTELSREPDEFTSATLEAVNAAAKKYALPSKSSLLLVGDWGKIETGLRQLDLGEIVVLDEEGKLRAAPAQ